MTTLVQIVLVQQNLRGKNLNLPHRKWDKILNDSRRVLPEQTWPQSPSVLDIPHHDGVFMCDNKRIRVTTYTELKTVKSECPTFPKGYLESKSPYQTHLIFPPLFLGFFFLPPQQETTDWINYKQQKFVWL